MTTTLFAIFGIALLATLAWVITRIVNIFVELEEVNEQAVNLRDDIEALENKTKELEKKSIDLERKVFANTQAQAAIGETLGNASETIARLSKANKEATECIDLLNKKVGTLQIEMLAASLYISRTPKQTDAKKKKMDRLAKYTELRNEGLSIRKAGEEVGVTYPTAKRYEKQRKAQSNETGDH